jgi:hypothetical protein
VFQVGEIILHVFRNFRHYSEGEEEGSVSKKNFAWWATKQRMHLSWEGRRVAFVLLFSPLRRRGDDFWHIVIICTTRIKSGTYP